jgi:signal transduction histidine kinase
MPSTQFPGGADGATLQYLASLGHELRNSLMPVVMLSDMLVSGSGIDQATRDGLHTINESGRLAARLVDDLLEFSRMKHGEFDLHLSQVDLHDVVRTSLSSLAPRMNEKHIVAVTSFEASAYVVRGDHERLLQTVVNLLANAVKYSPASASIVIRSWNPDRRSFALEVRDHGIGISPADLPHIFEPFYKAKHEHAEQPTDSAFGDGLGLGLAICDLLVTRHGGTLTAMSEGCGTGAAFQILLPVLDRTRMPAIGIHPRGTIRGVSSAA